MDWEMNLYGIVIIVFGIYMFWIGVWGLTHKRPMVLAARQFMWFLIAMYIPIIVQSLISLFEWGGGDPFFALMPIIEGALFVLLIFVFWRQMTGYMIFGVSDDVFRESLVSALNKLNLPYQETISKIKLTSLNANLQAAVASWMGTAQLRIKEREHMHYTKRIAETMDAYYKENDSKVNYTPFVIYLILGALLLFFAIIFVYWGIWIA